MLFSLLGSGDIKQAIISILLTLPVVLIALSSHEASHAYIAFKMGDRTAYNLGRMTFNPTKHIDPIGFLCMVLFGYGWAKPVPINARNFRNPKVGMALTAIAGPICNIILGLVSTLMHTLVIFFGSIFFDAISQNEFLINLTTVLATFFYLGGMYNFLLAAFNLIPLPPFDGSRFVNLFLPTKWYFKIMQYERYTMIAVLAISFICSRLFNFSPFLWVAETVFDFVYASLFSVLIFIAGLV